jgi:hypothetical protein
MINNFLRKYQFKFLTFSYYRLFYKINALGSNSDRDFIKPNLKHDLCVRQGTLISENKQNSNSSLGIIHRLSYSCTHKLLMLDGTR